MITLGKIKLSTTHLIVLLAILTVILAVAVYVVSQPKTDFTNGKTDLKLIQSQTVAVYQSQDGKNTSYELHISVDKSKTVKLPIVFRKNGIDANLTESEKRQAIDSWLKSRAIENAGHAVFPPPEMNKGPFIPFNFITNKVGN